MRVSTFTMPLIGHANGKFERGHHLLTSEPEKTADMIPGLDGRMACLAK